ncbi:MAG: septum formation initiator family protein [Bacteroidetes bacterium]|nr:MAG: septum formation initiator family protein [Bacteroidota bacterium]
MGWVQSVIKILTNRYLLALAALAVWMLFFDEKNYFAQRKRQAELDDLTQKISHYQAQLELTNEQLKSLDSSPAALEKFVREKYFMKRSNEEVFVIDTVKAP